MSVAIKTSGGYVIKTFNSVGNQENVARVLQDYVNSLPLGTYVLGGVSYDSKAKLYDELMTKLPKVTSAPATKAVPTAKPAAKPAAKPVITPKPAPAPAPVVAPSAPAPIPEPTTEPEPAPAPLDAKGQCIADPRMTWWCSGGRCVCCDDIVDPECKWQGL